MVKVTVLHVAIYSIYNATSLTSIVFQVKIVTVVKSGIQLV